MGEGWGFHSFICLLIVSRPDSGVGLLPTSHIKVSGGRVAHAFRVRRHALVLPLVGLLAVLDLQATWEKRQDPTKTRQERQRHRGKMRAEREMISQSVGDCARRTQDNLLNGGYLEFLRSVLSGSVSLRYANEGCHDRPASSPASPKNRGEI